MKKTIKKKLTLSKETLGGLSSGMRYVVGAGATGNNWCTEGWTCPAYGGCQPAESTKCNSTYYTVCDCPPLI